MGFSITHQHCLCGISVHIATLVNGIVTLISQTLGFAGALADVYSETYDLWRWRPTAGIVFCVLQWAFALLLIHGVLTKNPYFYYPFLIVQFLQCLVLFTFVAIFSIFTFFMFVAQFDIQQYTSYDALSLFVATILFGSNRLRQVLLRLCGCSTISIPVVRRATRRRRSEDTRSPVDCSRTTRNQPTR
ncbi:hypothetical protein M3Y94_00047700 [Aphelenchoides besseyi]|nr:hypothetical protein M3Y94_00047700 [Aphelenchoides besseyi]